MSESTNPASTLLLPPTPLPPNPYSPTTHPAWHAAFNACLPLAECAGTWADLSPGLAAAADTSGAAVDTMLALQTSPEVAGRTLGHALLRAPHDVARDCVAREITGCEGDAELLAGLAHVFIFGLARIFLNPAGLTPMDESPRYADQRTGVLPPGVTPKRLTKKAGPGWACLEVMHIVSQPLSRPCFEAMGGMTDRAQYKLQWASFPATILARLAGVEVRDVLPDLDIHHPANALMADSAPHTTFKQLELWLTPSLDDEGNVLANTYDTHFQHPFLAPMIGLPPQICLRHGTTPDGVDVPAPSRTLLEIHAWCAEVAHLSGAAAVLKRFYGEGGVLDQWSRNN
ncbi:hypothetical protein GSI_11042 [Ganoderma sinense ZZ0214-1]|uniref:HNH nuclease domain-containing protein n=1 Tax=Ganoderma sinense ZZ0214-1 TaxID=1077348 RepID=A0A2G8RZB8_9APHY|nr:hypothetical protein GSI_11042 [Ganoderma sinense ZZ0214-1]